MWTEFSGLRCLIFVSIFKSVRGFFPLCERFSCHHRRQFLLSLDPVDQKLKHTCLTGSGFKLQLKKCSICCFLDSLSEAGGFAGWSPLLCLVHNQWVCGKKWSVSLICSASKLNLGVRLRASSPACLAPTTPFCVSLREKSTGLASF